MIDGYAAVVDLEQAGQWRDVVLTLKDFRNLAGDSLPSWKDVHGLKLSGAERLIPARGDTTKSRIVGKDWQGPNPDFRNLRWVPTSGEK